jgi:hypothetical protein
MVVTDAPRNTIPGFARDARTAIPGALPLRALPLLTVARALLPAAGSVAVTTTTTGLQWQRRGWAEWGKSNGKSDDRNVQGGIHQHREILLAKA